MVKPLKKTNLYQMAKDIKANVEKNYTIPTKLTYDGINYYQLEFAYAMAYGLHHLKTDFTIPNFDAFKNPYGDKIDETISLLECKNQAKRVYNHIIKNAEVPNRVLVKGTKNYFIDIRHWIYYIAKMLVYYDEHKDLPLTCKFDSKAFEKPPAPSKKKYGHSKKSGCENMGQNNDYYCACHSLQEVFRNLTGVVINQSTIASVCGTTTAGTGHAGMNSCVAWFNKKYGYNLKVEWKNFSELGWNGIKDIINSNNKDCIIHNNYRDRWGHYETINGVYDNINVQNSLGDTCSYGCFCGYIEYRTKREFESYINGISQKSVMVITND